MGQSVRQVQPLVHKRYTIPRNQTRTTNDDIIGGPGGTNPSPPSISDPGHQSPVNLVSCFTYTTTFLFIYLFVNGDASSESNIHY